MPEVECSTVVQNTMDVVWPFVADMNRWAPFLTGYQSHEIENETDSIWILKGDVGILSREVRFRVHIDEWADGERVRFTMTGLSEPMEGGGTFVIREVEVGAEEADPLPTESPSFFQRWMRALFRFFYRKVHGPGVERQVPNESQRQGCELKLTLSMDALGPTAPLVNTMLAPLMLPAAEDLAQRIAAQIEKENGGHVAA